MVPQPALLTQTGSKSREARDRRSAAGLRQIPHSQFHANVRPYTFAWKDYGAQELEYYALLTRVSREYDARFEVRCRKISDLPVGAMRDLNLPPSLTESTGDIRTSTRGNNGSSFIRNRLLSTAVPDKRRETLVERKKQASGANGVVNTMSKVTSKQRRLKLRATNCQLFGVTAEIAEKDFRREDFLKALPIEKAAEIFNRRGEFISLCNPKSKQVDYQAEVHIHKMVRKTKDTGVAIHVNLRATNKGRARGEKPPFAEEVFQWLRQFIVVDATIKLSERCEFLFPAKQYESVFLLPLRMSGTLNYTGHPVFENSEMVGVRIEVGSNQIGLTSATQEIISGKGVIVALRRRTSADPAKLLTVESDVGVLYNIARSSVRSKRKQK